MNKMITSLVAISAVLAMAAGAYAQTSVNVSVNLTGGAPTYTSFGVYTDEAATTSVGSSIELDNDGVLISSGNKYYVGNLYVKVNEGNFERWYLGVYTSNEVMAATLTTPAFNIGNGSDLFIDETDEGGNPLERSLSWKYHNEVLFGNNPLSVGDVISSDVWELTNDTTFKYFVNIDPTPSGTNKDGSFEDLTDNEGLTAYTTTQAMLDTLKFASLAMYAMNFDYSNEVIEMGFGIDTSASDRLGTYKTTLNFELYTR